jgi:phosphohistidine phosphatase
MDLYFLRHAKAEPRTGRVSRPDHERALTPEGEQKMLEIAKGMRHLELRLDQIFTSPYVRARQTAEIAAQTLGLTSKTTLTAHLAPDGNPQLLIRELRQKQRTLGSVLLVGHEPYLSGLISTLTTGAPGLRLILKKASLAKLTTSSLRFGSCADLEWFLGPRQLVLVSKV